MSGYAKLFSSITESSLWCVGTKEARLLFVSMLARADSSGVVEASLPGLAKLASLTLEETVNAVNELESDDPHDRSGVAQGRRITRVGGGWALVNYSAYRDKQSDAERREYMRVYMQKYRAEHQPHVNSPVSNVSECKPVLVPASVSVSVPEESTTTLSEDRRLFDDQPVPSSPSAAGCDDSGKKTEGNGKLSERDLQTVERCYEFYPRHEKPNAAHKAILKALKDPQLKKLGALNGRSPIDELWMRVQEYAVYVDEHKGEFTSNGRSMIPYPASWFNAGSYLVDPTTKRHMLLEK